MRREYLHKSGCPLAIFPVTIIKEDISSSLNHHPLYQFVIHLNMKHQRQIKHIHSSQQPHNINNNYIDNQQVQARTINTLCQILLETHSLLIQALELITKCRRLNNNKFYAMHDTCNIQQAQQNERNSIKHTQNSSVQSHQFKPSVLHSLQFL